MQFHSENTSVFKDSDFLTVVVLPHLLITQTLEKSLENRSPRRSTTLPNHSSKSLAFWKRSYRFGRQNRYPKRSIACPQGVQKCIPSSVGSQKAVRITVMLEPLSTRRECNLHHSSVQQRPESMLEPLETVQEWMPAYFWILFFLQN